ncbi:MAG: aminotransferase class V-fold PLP-dependent enzyme [bacterium]
MKPEPSRFASLWALEPETIYLNHGSFGACPKRILEKQLEYRQRLESQPMRFLIRELEHLHSAARQKLASFTGAQAGDLVFVQNATSAVNTVFRSLKFNPGEEILITNHIYPACRRVLEYVCEQTGAKLVEARYPFPLQDPGRITETIIRAATPKTRITLIDHITSATALVQPVEEIVRELANRGVDTIVDGAHALGSIPVTIEKIGAAYYTANCHKWLCAPKSSAILYVRPDKQKKIVPLVISHAGHRAEPFAERFFWPGTYDPTAVLCAADMVDYMGALLPGGWPELMERNRSLCLEGRELLCSTLGIDKPCPDSLIASMATFPLPTPEEIPVFDYKSCDPLQELIFREYNLEIPVWYWGESPKRIMRISVQLYNSIEQYHYLASKLQELLV